MNEKTNRSVYWQCVKGICILAVVMIHSLNGISYGEGSVPYTITIIFRQFINFPVAVFIFMSGYFTNVESATNDKKTYVLTRGGRLLIPFCLWSMFYTMISAVQTLAAGERLRWESLIYKFIVGKAATPFYYIIVLFQLTLLTPFLVKVIRKGGIGSQLLWFITPVYLIFLYCYTIMNGTLPRLYETLFPAWFAFYYLGLRVHIDEEFHRKIEKCGRINLIIGALIFSFVEICILVFVGSNINFVCSQLKFSSTLFASALILWLLRKESLSTTSNAGIRFLKSVGDCSYGIFYIHCFVLSIVRQILEWIGADGMWPLYFFYYMVINIHSQLGDREDSKFDKQQLALWM